MTFRRIYHKKSKHIVLLNSAFLSADSHRTRVSPVKWKITLCLFPLFPLNLPYFPPFLCQPLSSLPNLRLAPSFPFSGNARQQPFRQHNHPRKQPMFRPSFVYPYRRSISCPLASSGLLYILFNYLLLILKFHYFQNI